MLAPDNTNCPINSTKSMLALDMFRHTIHQSAIIWWCVSVYFHISLVLHAKNVWLLCMRNSILMSLCAHPYVCGTPTKLSNNVALLFIQELYVSLDGWIENSLNTRKYNKIERLPYKTKRNNTQSTQCWLVHRDHSNRAETLFPKLLYSPDLPVLDANEAHEIRNRILKPYSFVVWFVVGKENVFRLCATIQCACRLTNLSCFRNKCGPEKFNDVSCEFRFFYLCVQKFNVLRS